MPDKQPYVEHARQAYQLVASIPHASGDRAYLLAVRHARQIVAFYECYTLGDPDYRDREMAHNLVWWQRCTGDKGWVGVAAWGARQAAAPAVDLALARRLDGAGVGGQRDQPGGGVSPMANQLCRAGVAGDHPRVPARASRASATCAAG